MLADPAIGDRIARKADDGHGPEAIRKTISQVNTMDEFHPERKMVLKRPSIQEITFKDEGQTDEMLWIWSGDALMDLERNQALKMTAKTIDGSDYLFVEAVGFGGKKLAGWQTPLYVMKRN